MDSEAVISANTVLNTGNLAYNLFSPKDVSYNLANGVHNTGFHITTITNSIIFQNITHGSSRGFVISNANNKTTLPKTNTAPDTGIKPITGPGEDITFYDNCKQASLDSGVTSCALHDQGAHLAQKTAGHTTASDQSIYILPHLLKYRARHQVMRNAPIKLPHY